jgi:SAGA-associated factor 29
MDGQWDIVVSSLQDIFNSNEELAFDEKRDHVKSRLEYMTETESGEAIEEITQHKENVDKSRRVLDEIMHNLQLVITLELEKKVEPKQKRGKSFWTSPYNVSDTIFLNSEVAFKLRQRASDEEWIQCEVTKIIGDGTKFEVRDPEPDENNNPGKTFKATWKDIIQIPTEEEVMELQSYPYGTRVLARYPETTTFYPAEVIGTKRDGRCRLKFEGEEEEGKETEVERRLVVPYPVR